MAVQAREVIKRVPPPRLHVAYKTRRGTMLRGSLESFLESDLARAYRGRVHLIFTSPPFPLNRKKKYGNLQGQAYVAWLAELAPRLRELLTADGSIVMELGNAWTPGKPVMSTLALEALLAFLKAGEMNLCQQFVCHNPAKLPSPAPWVTIKRIRVTDSYTHVWWMSPNEMPQANNARVLRPYGPDMLQLLRTGKYNSGTRPSHHRVSATSFLKRNDGAIPSNVLTFANTASTDAYQAYCRMRELTPHPARMPIGLAQFFIKFLTRPRQVVLDPFAGSNTTGAAAEGLKRHWLAIEPDADYVRGSRGRFAGALISTGMSPR